uniref:Cytochrome P450 89A2 n=2 Tax=Setaria italica TaxID=4555 RepID=K3YMP6_SETIT
DSQDDLVRCFLGLRVLATLPAVTGLIYRSRWRKLVELRRQQEQAYLPLIDSRRRDRPDRRGEPPAYVDTLADLRVPDDEHAAASGGGNHRNRRRRQQQQRRLTNGELVGLCSEFLGAGTEPAAAALQWIMAHLVKRPDAQRALRNDIDAAVPTDAEEVLGKLEYLNVVIMEGLRLHPTVPMVLRQVMAEDHVVVDGRRLPAGTAVHFPLARLAQDETAWADPREFRPERFLAGGEGEGVSLVAAAGSAGEIRMMPFGGGRRMCPGMGAAVLHLGYFVANLVREFGWSEADGDLAVDLLPHPGFFTVMKRPLRARLVRRRREATPC